MHLRRKVMGILSTARPARCFVKQVTFKREKKNQKLSEWYIRHDLIITPKMSRMDTNCKSTAVTMQLWISGLIDLEEQ